MLSMMIWSDSCIDIGVVRDCALYRSTIRRISKVAGKSVHKDQYLTTTIASSILIEAK